MVVLGCFVLGTGVAMLLTADLGSDGYSTLVNGVSKASGISFLVANLLISLLFLLVALMFGSDGLSILGSAFAAFLFVLGIEALTRRRLASYLVRVVLLLAALSLAGLVFAGLIASWQTTVVLLLASLAVVFLFLNLRERRRT